MIDTKLEMDLIRQKIMAGLGVSEAMMNGPAAYATSGIGYDPAIQELVRKMADPFFTLQDPDDPTRVIWKAMTRDEYVKENLDWEMRRCRGRKRLRKKKAKRALRQRWGFLQMSRMLSRRTNYAAVARRLVTVEPLPDPVKPIYMRDIDIAEVTEEDLLNDDPVPFFGRPSEVAAKITESEDERILAMLTEIGEPDCPPIADDLT